MFVAKSQIYVFIACFALGGGCGIFFSLAAAFKFFIKNKYVRAIPDTIAFILCAVFYVIFAYSLKFPSFRVYMPFGVILGIAVYMKSFHIILAIIWKKLYNNKIKLIFCA